MGPKGLAQQQRHNYCILAVEIGAEHGILFGPAIDRCAARTEALGYTIDHDPCLWRRNMTVSWTSFCALRHSAMPLDAAAVYQKLDSCSAGTGVTVRHLAHG